MSGHPVLLVELDDDTGTFPHDVTAWVNLRAGWSLDRGRRDEFSDIDPAVLRLQFDNTDGRFTLGSPLYGIRIDQPIRITETYGATTSVRHTGFVQDWPTVWDSPTAVRAVMRITSVDRQARLQRRGLPDPIDYELRADSPLASFPLADEPGATSTVDYLTNGWRLVEFDSGAAMTFGTETQVGSGVAFAGGKHLRQQTPFSFQAETIELWVQSNTRPSAPGWLANLQRNYKPVSKFGIEIDTDGTAFLSYAVGGDLVGFSFSTGDLCDGEAHHLVARFTSDTVQLYVDGALFDEFIDTEDPIDIPDWRRLAIGEDLGSGVAVAHVSLYAGELAPERVLQHYRAGVGVGESSDERIQRIATYAGIEPADLGLEPGILASTAHQSGLKDTKVAAAFSEVVAAEGGTLFVSGPGSITMQNRYHRALGAAGTPVVTLTSSEIDDDVVITGDKQYLQNRVTGARVNGATQTVESPTSLDLYDEYPSSLSGLLVTTDEEVLDRITWQANVYDTPLPRMSSVTIDLLTLADDAQVEALLGLELGDWVLITDLPPTSPIAQGDLIVEGISEEQSVTSWTLTLNTVSANLFRAWVLGDATYGVLGSTTRLHY